MSLEAARAAKARELAGKTYAPLMREVEELAAKFKGREFELKFDATSQPDVNFAKIRSECEIRRANLEKGKF